MVNDLYMDRPDTLSINALPAKLLAYGFASYISEIRSI